MTGLRRRVYAVLALVFAAGAVLGFAHRAPADPRAQNEQQVAPGAQPPPGTSSAQLVAQGRSLFEQTCSSCHGTDAQGIRGVAPSLHGVGERAADFYLRTGRMPLAAPRDEPQRGQSPFSPDEIHALVAYVGSFGGPRVPAVHPENGDLEEGMRLFSDNCMSCHQVLGRGGITTGAFVPTLQQSEPVDVAEAMAIGPYVMPHFRGQFTQHQVDSIARYVLSTRHPVDAGGWGIGHIGPIPEGMVTWLLAIFALLLVTRLIGERTTR